MKYGRQRWKLRGRIEINGKQVWDSEEMVFLPLITEFLSIKVVFIQLHSLIYCLLILPSSFFSHILLISISYSCHIHMCSTVTSICETLMHITAQQLDFDLFFSPSGSMTHN